jgi:hypothetical protein
MATLHEIIEQNKGKIITVVFKKKDGQIRTLNGIYGVTKFIKGGPTKYDPNRYIVLWDIAKRDYRSVDKSTLMEVRTDRQTFRAANLV